MFKVKGIVTHYRPHIDETCAIWLLRKLGEKEFHGIREAKVQFADAGDRTPNGRPWQEWHDQGYILIGIGGGRFDEHANQKSARKKEHCATSLVAKALGIDDDPVFKPIIEAVVENDLRGSGSLLDLEAIYQRQVQYWTTTKTEYERSAQVEEIKWSGGRKFNIVTLQSDDEQVLRYARSKHGANAGIVIQKKSTGHVQIHTSPYHGLFLYDVAKLLRIEEQKAGGKEPLRVLDPRVLASEGTLQEIPEWFFHVGMQKLMNGSLTAKNVPPTKMPLSWIQNLIRIGINPGRFESSRQKECEAGKCTAQAKGCPWYTWQLKRCSEVRNTRKAS